MPAERTTTRRVLTLADLPRPAPNAIASWVKLWTKPEPARLDLATLGGRFAIDLPLLPKMFWTARSEDARAVFQDKTGALSFGAGLRRIAPHERLFGDRIMSWWASDDHLATRRKVLPAFRGTALAEYEPAIEAVARRVIRDLPVGEPVRFHSAMRTLARDVIIAVVFGVTESDRHDRLAGLLTRLDERIGSRAFAARYAFSMVAGGRWLPDRDLDELLAGIDAFTYDEMTDRRRRGDESTSDCLGVFMDLQRGVDDQSLDDEMIAGFQRLLLLAGQDTTAATLAWAVELLARSPDALGALQRSVAAGEDRYLDAVVLETLRLRPTIGFTVRSALESVVVDDVVVPEGAMVFVYINAIHRDPENYEHPDEFRPERFLDTTPDASTWLPFGGGINRCLGERMALLEARTLLRTLIQELDVVPTDTPHEAQRAETILMVPDKGATVTFRPRRAATTST